MLFFSRRSIMSLNLKMSEACHCIVALVFGPRSSKVSISYVGANRLKTFPIQSHFVFSLKRVNNGFVLLFSFFFFPLRAPVCIVSS